MSDTITVVGTVATAPRHVKTEEQLEVTTFRLASAHRRYDRKSQRWVDGDTNWYTIVAFRQLASNAAQSIKKGDRVIAFGRPRVRDWTNADRSGTTMEVEVDSLGHDLLWGRTAYTKTAARRDPEAEPGGAGASPAPSPEVVAEAAAEAGSAGSGDTSLAGAHWPTASVGGTAPVETREPAAAF